MRFLPAHRTARQLIPLCLAIAACQTPASVSTIQPNAESLAEGTLATAPVVSSADRNLATALLMQWWDLFEAPETKDRSFIVDKIFSEDVVLRMSEGDLIGRTAIGTALENLPKTRGRSHQLLTINLADAGADAYTLSATFNYQILQLDGQLDSGESAYEHTVRKTTNGQFVLTEITAEVLAPGNDAKFSPSYMRNRAYGTLAYYLGQTDTLKDSYPALQTILTELAEIHGMFDPAQQSFNPRGDGVLLGYEEISNWLASRQTSFDAVAHEIVHIDVLSENEDQIQIAAEIKTKAWAKSGDQISVVVPVRIAMIDKDEAFLRILRIER